MRASHRQENRVKKGGMADEEQGHGRCGAVRLSLEYGRRKIRVCADTFEPPQDFRGRRRRGAGEDGAELQGKARAVYMMRKRLAEGRQLFAGNLEGNGGYDESCGR